LLVCPRLIVTSYTTPAFIGSAFSKLFRYFARICPSGQNQRVAIQVDIDELGGEVGVRRVGGNAVLRPDVAGDLTAPRAAAWKITRRPGC
jgi:hypothetical protein